MRNMRIVRDRHGFAAYSTVETELPVALALAYAGFRGGALITEEVLSSASNDAIEVANRVVNRFIDCYRDLRGEYWIRPIQRDEMYELKVEWPNPSGVRGISAVMNFPGGGIGPAIRPTREANDALARCVRVDQRLAVYRELILDARDSLDRGEAGVSVMQAHTAVETGIKTITRRFFRRNPEPPAAMRKRVGCRDNRQNLLDDMLERGNVDAMLINGLGLMLGTAPDENDTPWHEWQICRGARNAMAHHGAEPELDEAKRGVAAAAKLLDQYIAVAHTSVPELTPFEETKLALSEVCPSGLSRQFTRLVLPIAKRIGCRITFRSILGHPTKWRRDLQLLREDQGDIVVLWIDARLSDGEKEILVAQALLHQDLLNRGYPRGRVAEELPFEEYRSAWEHLAQTLTQTVLDVVIDRLLRSNGFDTSPMRKASTSTAIRQFLSPGYQCPSHDETRYWALPMNFARTYLLAEEGDRSALASAFSGACPDLSKIADEMILRLRETELKTQEDCLKAMIGVQSATMMLGSCGVYDPASRATYGRGIVRLPPNS